MQSGAPQMGCPGNGKYAGAARGVMGQIQEGVVIPPLPVSFSGTRAS